MKCSEEKSSNEEVAKNDNLMEMAIEQLARLFLQQALLKQNSPIKKVGGEQGLCNFEDFESNISK